MKNLEYTRVLTSNASFQLVRTNPKLTGNLKLTVNEAGDLWLNAIKANVELSKDDYSRFPVDTEQSLASNIFRFFKNGTTPNEIIFSLPREADLTRTSADFKDQYDFSNYFSGVKYFPSSKYSEKFSYLAPLYLKQDLPKYFVIFKIKDPLNSPIDVSKTNFEAGQSRTDYLIELFKTATIVKTFDMGPSSKLGSYLRTYMSSPNYPSGPLSVAFGEDDYSTWNGILVDSGVFGSRGELFYNQYRQSSPLKSFEETITKGFERNGVIVSNILNLEFIFNDDTSEKYDIDRYLGVYLDSIEISKLDIDLDKAYRQRGTWENTPRLRRTYSDSEETTLVQKNPEGVRVPYTNLDFNMTEFVDIFTDSESLYFNYLTDKYGKLHLPKLDDPYSVDGSVPISVIANAVDYIGETTVIEVASTVPHEYDTNDLVIIESIESDIAGSFLITRIDDYRFSYILPQVVALPADVIATSTMDIGSGTLRLSDTSIDFADMFGPAVDIFLQDTGFASYAPGKSYTVVKINSNFSHGDELKIYRPTGTRVDANGKHDLFTATSQYDLIPNPGEFYSFNDYDGSTGFDTFYFNCDGTPSQNAIALSGCINNVRSRTFTAFPYNEYVFIICNTPGDYDQIHKISFNSPGGVYNPIEIDGIPSVDIVSIPVPFSGGSQFVGNRLVIDKSHFSKINGNLNDLLVKTDNGWSKILKTSKYIDLVNEAGISDPTLRSKAIGEYLDNIVLTLVDEAVPTIAYTQFNIRRKFRPSFGLLSFYPIKDLDFDFYSSGYLNFPEIDLYQHYYVPANTSLLTFGEVYRVAGGSVIVNGTEYSDGQTFTVDYLSSYSVSLGSPVVYYYADGSSGSSSIVPIQDANGDLRDFPGFSILKDPAKVVAADESLTYRLKTKYINGLTATEYDFYKENESSDFALRSKMIPYITKWGILGGVDSRDNPYRLNTELVFGKNNFSSDHEDRTQNPDNFTHEWFYIESKFNYLNDPETAKKNSYYFDTPFSLAQLLGDSEYFLEYFTYTPSFGTNDLGEKIDIAPTQFRYSTIAKNRIGEYETFFKGIKFSFRDVIDPTALGSNGKPIAQKITNRFEGYRFSCILKPVPERSLDATQPPITYKVIEHKDFKFIVVVIELAIGSLNQIADYWKANPFSGGFSTLTNDPIGSADAIHFADPNYSIELDSTRPFDTIFGDYRISFNSDEVSNLTHALLYSLKNKKFNTGLDNFSNVKLSSKLKIYDSGIITVAGSNTTRGSISQLANPFIPEYPSLLVEEISLPSSIGLFCAIDTQTTTAYFVDQADILTGTPRNVNPVTSTVSSFANYEVLNQSDLYLTSPTPIFPYTTRYISPLDIDGDQYEPFVSSNFSFFAILGGENYFEKIMEKLSFASFKTYVNSNSPFVQYLSYSLDEDGDPVLSDSPNMYVEIPDVSEISKVSQVISIVDTNRPSQYSFEPVIGYAYEVSQLANPLELSRYRGDYEPITKDILHCRSNFKFIKNQIADLNLSNTKLNTNVSDLLTIRNFSHLKVADTKVLELESDSAYSPVYPRVGEIAIDQTDLFLLQSNWDWGFHKKYTSQTTFSNVSGAIRVEEDENFIGKIIALPEFIELEDYQVQWLAVNEELTNVDVSNISIVAKDSAKTIEGLININNVLTEYLIADGISQKFDEFLNTSVEYIGSFDSIESYVREYIKLNILKLYDVETVEFFSKRNAELVSGTELTNSNTVQFVFLNDSDRFKEGYSNLKTVQINKPDRLIVRFSIQKKLDAGVNISPKVKIKFI